MTSDLSDDRTLKEWDRQVESSYAHNSRLYEYMAAAADLDEIVAFLGWDAHQPAYNVFLRRWLPRVPGYLRGPLLEHVEIEEAEKHSELFSRMLQNLQSRCAVKKTEFALDRLERLNFTFEARCAGEKDFAFFAGGFFATEVMSAKRCRQLYGGLKRFAVRDEELEYLRIHFTSDEEHARQVRDLFLAATLRHHPALGGSIAEGIADRLGRSVEFLSWYESEFLPRLR